MYEIKIKFLQHQSCYLIATPRIIMNKVCVYIEGNRYHHCCQPMFLVRPNNVKMTVERMLRS